MNLQNQIDYLHEYYNQDMFDECTVPEGLNMERVRGAIIMRCGLLTPLFSEPHTQRAATQQFFFENQWNFEHVLNVIKSEYSPIENVAEWRNETTKNSGSENLEINRISDELHSGTDRRLIEETGSQTSDRRTETNDTIETGKTTTESGTTTTADSGTTETAESGTTSTTGTDSGTKTVDRTVDVDKSANNTSAESGATTVTMEISAENATTYQADRKETTGHGKTVTDSGSETEDTTDNSTESVTSENKSTVTHGKIDTVTHGKTETVTHGKSVSEIGTQTFDGVEQSMESVEKDAETSDSFTHGEQIERGSTDKHTTSKDGTTEYEVFRHGNIGVTSNQNLINEELDLLQRFNPYKFIAELYESALMVGLY